MSDSWLCSVCCGRTGESVVLRFGGVGVGSYVDGRVPLSYVCAVAMCDDDAACGVRGPFAVYVCLCLILRQCGLVVVKWSCLVVAL